MQLKSNQHNASHTLYRCVQYEENLTLISMKTKEKHQLIFILGLAISLVACNQMSEQIRDKSAGLNGGFEVSKNGLPVNWLMYTSNTVPNADFRIVLDNQDYKEG